MAGIGVAYPPLTAIAAGINNTVIVNVLGDFPTAAAGTITLASNTKYQLGANVDIGTDTLTFSNGSGLAASGSFTATLIYTGTASMLNGVDVNATICDITLTAASAQIYNFSETAAGNSKIILISDVLVTACLTTGTFDQNRTVVIDGTTILDCTDGFVFTGATQTSIRIVSAALLSTSTTFVGLDFTGSTQKTVNLDGIILAGGAGSIGIKGDAASANITSGFLANVKNVQFEGVTTPLSGITTNDIRWNFQGNGIVPDTMADAMVSLNSNATVTPLTQDTPTLVLGTFTDERSSHYTNTAAGRVTYIGERDVTVPVNAVLVIDPASATNKDIRAYIALNGTVIANSGKTIRIDSGDPLEITLLWQLTLSTDDFLELFIENLSDSIDATVIDAILRVR